MSEPRARLFVAADLPPAIRAAAAAWRDRHAGPDSGWRPVADESLHVTLAFLGMRPEDEVDALGAAVLEVAAPATGLTLGAPRLLPPRRARVMALAITDPSGSLTALRERVTGVLQRDFGLEPERRPFRPHVTVARARRDARPAPTELAPVHAEPFGAAALTLYRSRLGPGGARYEPVGARRRQPVCALHPSLDGRPSNAGRSYACLSIAVTIMMSFRHV